MWRISDMWRILDFLLYTPWSTPSVTVAKNSSVYALHSSVHAHGEVIRGGIFKHFKTSMGCSSIGTVGH